jgi:hypothetical protein
MNALHEVFETSIGRSKQAPTAMRLENKRCESPFDP